MANAARIVSVSFVIAVTDIYGSLAWVRSTDLLINSQTLLPTELLGNNFGLLAWVTFYLFVDLQMIFFSSRRSSVSFVLGFISIG